MTNPTNGSTDSPTPTPTLACRECLYLFDGIAENPNTRVLCPECGLTRTPIYRDEVYQTKHLIRDLIVSFIIPTTLPLLIALVFYALWDSVYCISMIVVFVMPWVVLGMLAPTFKRLKFESSVPVPSIPQWAIFASTLTSALPAAACWVILLFVLF